MNLLKKTIIFFALCATSLNAHYFWVNSFESFTHKPGHTTVSLGWGHSMPIDDVLNSVNGKLTIADFFIISPDGEKIKLTIPSSEAQKASLKVKDFDVYNANLGLQKIALKKESTKGVYTISAKNKPTFFTQYVDSKDRQRLKLTTIDKIKDLKKVILSGQYESLAKSYLTLGKWNEPKPTNKGLEIIPKTDLSNIKVGDLVEFEVLFYGKPLHTSANNIVFIEAKSNSFGQNDGYSLMSYIGYGKAQIRVPSSGQWLISCIYKSNVTKDNELKQLYGKVNTAFNANTLTFNVK